MSAPAGWKQISGVTLVDLPDIDAGKITSGVLADARIPNLPITKITDLDSRLNAKADNDAISGLHSLIDTKADIGALTNLSQQIDTKSNIGELRLTNLSNFPSNPVIGQFANVQGVIFLYVGT